MRTIVGTAPNQVPLNQHLGELAHLDRLYFTRNTFRIEATTEAFAKTGVTEVLPVPTTISGDTDKFSLSSFTVEKSGVFFFHFKQTNTSYSGAGSAYFRVYIGSRTFQVSVPASSGTISFSAAYYVEAGTLVTLKYEATVAGDITAIDPGELVIKRLITGEDL